MSPCPRCDGSMHTHHNPSLGIGLAIHSYIRICDKCDFAAFFPEELVDEYKRSLAHQARSQPVPTRKGWFRRRKK